MFPEDLELGCCPSASSKIRKQFLSTCIPEQLVGPPIVSDLCSVLVLLNCERASGKISFCDDETCISLSTSKPNGASELGFSKSLPANWKVKNYAGLQVIYIRFTQAKFAKELCLRSHVVLRNLSENAAQQSQENKRFMFTV